MTLTDRLRELKEVCEKATPVNKWRAVGNLPFYAELKKPAPSLSKHDDSRSTYWRIEDVEFVLQARTMLPRLIEALEKAIEQRDHYVEVAADHEPFKKDLAELNKQITEILDP